jgi:hypothetical protein
MTSKVTKIIVLIVLVIAIMGTATLLINSVQRPAPTPGTTVGHSFMYVYSPYNEAQTQNTPSSNSSSMVPLGLALTGEVAATVIILRSIIIRSPAKSNRQSAT